MISLLIATIVLQTPNTTGAPTVAPAPTQATQTSAPATPAGLISNMFAYYTSAVTLAGSIRMTQEAQGRAVVTDTDVQFVRPNRIYVRQSEHGGEGRSFLLTSDGQTFSYDKPKDIQGPARCVEYTRTAYQLLDLSDIYTATLNSIVDPSPILNVAIGRKPDLIRLTGQLLDYRIVGSYKDGSDTIYQIAGQYATAPNHPVAGKYQIDVSETGAFRRFVIKQYYAVPGHANMPPVEVTTTWVSTLQVDAKTNDSLFKTVK
jgi:hypothetical protein